MEKTSFKNMLHRGRKERENIFRLLLQVDKELPLRNLCPKVSPRERLGTEFNIWNLKSHYLRFYFKIDEDSTVSGHAAEK